MFWSHLYIYIYIKIPVHPFRKSSLAAIVVFYFSFFGGEKQFISVVNSSEMGALLCFVIYRLTLMGLIQ